MLDTIVLGLIGHPFLHGEEADPWEIRSVDFKSFPRYNYVSGTSLGEMTDEILIEKSLEVVQRSLAPDHTR